MSSTPFNLALEEAPPPFDGDCRPDVGVVLTSERRLVAVVLVAVETGLLIFRGGRGLVGLVAPPTCF